MVQVLRPPRRCQVRWTSRYSSADSLPRAMAERTSLRKISAPPPVRESSPAAFKRAQRFGDGLLRQPGQVEDLDGGEAFQLQAAGPARASALSMSV